MKKHTIKILSVIFVIGTIFTLPATVYASNGNEELCKQYNYLTIDSVNTYGIDKPTKVWDLSKKGQYNFSGWCFGNRLYTNYLFTGVKVVQIKVHNTGSDKTTVKLLKKQAGVDWSASTRTIKPGDTLIWTVDNLDSSAKYYLAFSTSSEIEGYIR